MSDISCPHCGSPLKLDFKKSKIETHPVYSCDCGVYGYFKVLGTEVGKKTKEKLANKKAINEIPF